METGMKMKVIFGNGIETESVISLGVDNGNEKPKWREKTEMDMKHENEQENENGNGNENERDIGNGIEKSKWNRK